MSAAFSKRSQNKKKASAQEFRDVSNSFREGTRREKTRLKKVTYLLILTYLVSQSVRPKYVLLHVVVLCFLQVFRSSNFAYNYYK